MARIPAAMVLGDRAARLPNTSCIAFAGADAEAVLHRLDRAGIAAASGAACSAGSVEPSHVLRAMAVPIPSRAAPSACRCCATPPTPTSAAWWPCCPTSSPICGRRAAAPTLPRRDSMP